MGEKKVTIMVIKIDLSCEKCQKKIKKILCKISQIQNQIYDEKANTVTITVVCCSPEKIKKKICCKGGDSIKCIEIQEPETACCRECYKECSGGPCYRGCGRPFPCYEGYRTPAPCYGAYERPVCNSWGGGGDHCGGCGHCGCRRDCYVGRCNYLCKENPSACNFM